MLRRQVAVDEGLLLVPAMGGIHTCFLRFPIDVAYLDKHLRVVAVRHAMLPWRVWVPCDRDAAMALELPAGRLTATDTRVGDPLQVLLRAWQ
jgi:uncharacterized membrane protein (UPF0127 family)